MGGDGEDIRNLMTAKIKDISREVVREEMKNCSVGVEHDTKIDEHERRLTNVEKDVKDVPEKITNAVGGVFTKLDDFKKEVVGYWIGILGAIIAELVVVLVAIGFAITKMKA